MCLLSNLQYKLTIMQQFTPTSLMMVGLVAREHIRRGAASDVSTTAKLCFCMDGNMHV